MSDLVRAPPASKIFRMHKALPFRTYWRQFQQEVICMKLNSGDTAPKSANYKVISPEGKVIGSVYMREGETLPPTQMSGCHYEAE